MNFAPYIFIAVTVLIPFISALIVLKFIFHVPDAYPTTLLGIYILSGLLGLFFGNSIPYLKFLLPAIIFSVIVYRKYKITKGQTALLVAIVGLVNLILVAYTAKNFN